jgi:hypothetical protein
MVATVRHVTSSSGLRKFQTDGFLSDRVYDWSSVPILMLQIANFSDYWYLLTILQKITSVAADWVLNIYRS